MARPDAERAEIDLAVSGLKPDWPPRTATRWYRPRRALSAGSCRCSKTWANGRSRQNTRPSAGLQNDFSSDERESACKSGVFLEAADDRRTASPESVRPDADGQRDCNNEKDLQMRSFSRAAEGIRTLDLLHGKQYLWSPFGAHIPCKRWGSRMRAAFYDSPAFTASSRGFGYRMGSGGAETRVTRRRRPRLARLRCGRVRTWWPVQSPRRPARRPCRSRGRR